MKANTSEKFNADQLFMMAAKVEQNAADFYTKAAALHASKHNVAFLRNLAAMERAHLETFDAMRKALPPNCRIPPDDHPYLKATLYLNTMADAGGGEGTLSSAQPLSSADSLESLVIKGIRFETEAIAFYTGLMGSVPAALGRDHVNRIIAEERAHVVVLSEELRKLRKSA